MNLKLTALLYSVFFSLSTLLAGTPVASIFFSNPIVSTNLTHTFNASSSAESYTFQTNKGGQSCRQIPPSKYGYFNVNDATIPSTQNNVIVNIAFFDEGSTKMNFQYNANDGNNNKSLTIQQTGSNNWVTAKLAITNASFRNASNSSADFRISGNGVDIYIREISIEVGTLTPESELVPSTTASSYSEFIGKSVAGYQVWFVAGSLTSGWTHWNSRTQGAPGPTTSHFEVCPDISEYPEEILKPTSLAPMGNGTPFKLFTSSSKEVIDIHLKWMKDYGIDGAAVQRFIGNIGGSIVQSPTESILKVKNAAEANERIFYICYDTSSSGMEATWDETIKMDWVYNVEQKNLTTSPAYAKVGNKPVVQLWGIGMKGGKNPGTAAETIALINFFKARGCYVIGGVPKGWRTGTSDSKGVTQPATVLGDNENFLPVYESLHMISPWMPGRIRDNATADALLTSTMEPDKSYCDARNIHYMAVNFPGFAWSQWNDGDVNWAPRNAGDFMWHQATNIKKLGVQNMYFAMFDEYDEGTAIMKNATDWSMIPTNQYFLTSSADGLWCSSDFQLRVAGAAVAMLKGQRPATTHVPVAHSDGPVYYRNSFEKRTTVYNYVNDVATKNGTFNLDPCFYKDAVITTANMLSPSVTIQQAAVRSGLYSVSFAATVANSTATARHYYKISEVKIAVKPGMELSFWKQTVNDLGRNVSVDIITKNNKTLRDYGYVDQNGLNMHPLNSRGNVGAGYEKFTCRLGYGTLLGDTITGIVIAYEKLGEGSVNANFDDFLIEVPANSTAHNPILIRNAFNISYNSKSSTVNINIAGNDAPYTLKVFTTSGINLLTRNSTNRIQSIDLSPYGKAVYILTITIGNTTYYHKIIS